MSDQTTTENPSAPLTPAVPAKPAEIKSLMSWYNQKKGKRDLLCLVVVMNEWDFRQEENTSTEAMMTEAEYDAHMAAARKLHEAAIKKVKRASQAPIVCHPELLVGVIIRKPSVPEFEALMSHIKDENKSTEETSAYFRDDLMQRLLWPTQGASQLAYLMEEVPAFLTVFPQRILEISGFSKADSKKLG